MASIRVILLTCRRPALLRRALVSLIAQTFTDWVCELHNDAPDDRAPSDILAEIAYGDIRFSYHHHNPAWGAVKAFNYCFSGGAEAYSSLLEDDNWWEPTLLAHLMDALSKHPSVALAWSNMKVWQESRDGSWLDTGSTIWPEGVQPKIYRWPVLLQAFEGLHSNGAMLLRRSAGSLVPDSTPFALVEAVRERSITGGYLFLPEALAHFALTRETARSKDRMLWVQGQLLLSGSFFETVPLTSAAWDELWRLCQEDRPRRTGILLLLAVAGIRRREILSRATAGDILRFLTSFVGSLRANLRGLRFRGDHKQLWEWLLTESAARTEESGVWDRARLEAGSLFARRTSKRD